MTEEEKKELFKVPDCKTESLDKSLTCSFIDALKKHIELLEKKKRQVEYEFMNSETPNLCKGYILGLNYAIEQLYCDIENLRKNQ